VLPAYGSLCTSLLPLRPWKHSLLALPVSLCCYLARLRILVTSAYAQGIRLASAIMAPLTVCDDFLIIGAALYLVAGRAGQIRRQVILFLACAVCLVVTALMEFTVSRIRYRLGSLNRPVLFQFGTIDCLHLWVLLWTHLGYTYS
jgi:hypothetical protein